MKKVNTLATVAILVLGIQTVAGPLSQTLKSFENNADYVRPFSTLLGSVSNAGWYQSATIGRDFGFYIGLPVSVTYIAKADREYSGTYTDAGCVDCKKYNVDSLSHCQDCQECQPFTAPTILGAIAAPVLKNTRLNVRGDFQRTELVRFTDGVKELADLPLIPFTSLQIGLSCFYTELKLRYIGIPTLGGISFMMPGVGLQHDFRYLLPDLPVSVSLAGNMTFLMAGYSPAEISGSMNLNGTFSFLGVLVGYRYQALEFFLEGGWERASLKTSGSFTVPPDVETISPDLSLSGRNMFRAELGISLLIGYNPMITQAAGVNFGNTLNIIAFKYEKK